MGPPPFFFFTPARVPFLPGFVAFYFFLFLLVSPFNFFVSGELIQFWSINTYRQEERAVWDVCAVA